MCKMMISPGIFFLFIQFSCLGLLGWGGGVKGQKTAENEQ